ncbi:hypothetical protein ACFYO0_14470 [Streptomyces sp. NPDC006365]|uniref:hypothetical protein n=1 Tax=Streptomyces sp. NPDC006365 TaxID=3364744 RepID=UPI0036A12C14
MHRHGTVFEELAVEVMAQLPNDEARREVLALIDVVRTNPRAWPDVRDPGSVEEIREACGSRCWIQFMRSCRGHRGTRDRVGRVR